MLGFPKAASSIAGTGPPPRLLLPCRRQPAPLHFGAAQMDGSSSSMGAIQRAGSSVILPLVHRDKCKCRIIKALMAKTEKNYGRMFYICSTRTVL